jgi:hypothetical protein
MSRGTVFESSSARPGSGLRKPFYARRGRLRGSVWGSRTRLVQQAAPTWARHPAAGCAAKCRPIAPSCENAGPE